MDTLAFLAVAAAIAVYSLASRRLAASIVTAPMIFAALGFVLGQGFGSETFDPGRGFIHLLAELTLVFVLFSDAARIDLAFARRYHALPVRLLAIGMPLTIVLGTAIALVMPLGLSLVVPLLGAGIWWASRRGWLPVRAWLLVVALQAVIVAGGYAALETGGYVERSFFSTEAGGVAMVTRLERINDDGTPAPAAARWALKLPPDGAVSEAIAFLRGLFFIEPGHYRTIVFILQDQPFAQDDKPASEPQARAWISRGANIISPDVGQKSYAGAHCTALIYEFASDGASVKLVDGGLTGKEHLARSGLLAALEPAR